MMRNSGSVHALPLNKAIASVQKQTTRKKKIEHPIALNEEQVLVLRVRQAGRRRTVTIGKMSLPAFLAWYEEWMEMTDQRIQMVVDAKNQLRVQEGKKPRRSKIPMQRLLVELRGTVQEAHGYQGCDAEYIKTLKWYFVHYLFSMAVFSEFCVFKPIEAVTEKEVAA